MCIDRLNQMISLFQTNFQNTQPEMTCSKLTIDTLEQGEKYVQS